MTNEDKNLLFKDLCARLAYGVKLQWFDEIVDLWRISIDHNQNLVSFKNKIDPYAHDEIHCGYQGCTITVAPECVKPYLRPMSSMTDEELQEIKSIDLFGTDIEYNTKGVIETYGRITIEELNAFFNWLLSHHFDIHGLVKKGLALEAPEGMYDL